MSEYPYSPESAQTELMSAAYHGDTDEVTRLLTLPFDIDASPFIEGCRHRSLFKLGR